MKKSNKIAMAVMSLVMAMSLVGCSGNNTPTPQASQGEQVESENSQAVQSEQGEQVQVGKAGKEQAENIKKANKNINRQLANRQVIKFGIDKVKGLVEEGSDSVDTDNTDDTTADTPDDTENSTEEEQKESSAEQSKQGEQTEQAQQDEQKQQEAVERSSTSTAPASTGTKTVITRDNLPLPLNEDWITYVVKFQDTKGNDFPMDMPATGFAKHGDTLYLDGNVAIDAGVMQMRYINEAVIEFQFKSDKTGYLEFAWNPINKSTPGFDETKEFLNAWIQTEETDTWDKVHVVTITVDYTQPASNLDKLCKMEFSEV